LIPKGLTPTQGGRAGGRGRETKPDGGVGGGARAQQLLQTYRGGADELARSLHRNGWKYPASAKRRRPSLPVFGQRGGRRREDGGGSYSSEWARLGIRSLGQLQLTRGFPPTSRSTRRQRYAMARSPGAVVSRCPHVRQLSCCRGTGFSTVLRSQTTQFQDGVGGRVFGRTHQPGIAEDVSSL